MQNYLVLVVGLPNVGKSSFINAVRYVGKGAGKAARIVSIYSGNFVSEETGQLVPSNIMISDTPGLLEPKTRCFTAKLSLAACGLLDQTTLDREILIDYLLFMWNYKRKFDYVKVLDLSAPTHDVKHLISHVCEKQNFFSKRHTREFAHLMETYDDFLQFQKVANQTPDIHRACVYLLSEFNKGKLGRMTIYPEDEDDVQSAIPQSDVGPTQADLMRLQENLTKLDTSKDWYSFFMYYALSILIEIVKDPWGFITKLAFVLLPLTLLSAYCSYRLAREIKKQEKETKAKQQMLNNIAKAKTRSSHAKND
ncbi:Mitochondrial GTPase [Cichlidogyrus casuarinus]|uniref:Mitochondrial GTPase n=1 Tax=Cichlidogyrus casuarinus TaxID=1844966 RepID=A0ABD2QIS8_9PLAT